ncbi:hypothetical protein IWZ01DRAFT_280186 [Phyllosticta capitalensis]
MASSTAKRLTSLFNFSSLNLAEEPPKEEAKSSPTTDAPAPANRGRRLSLSKRLSRSQSRDRSASQHPQGSDPDQPPVPPIPTNISRKSTALSSPTDDGEDLPLPPPVRVDSFSRSSSRNSLRPGSQASAARPESSFLDVPSDGMLAPGSPSKLKRRSIFGKPIRKSHVEASGPQAWIVGHEGKPEYSIAALQNGERIVELWDELGDTYVYLFPRTSGKGPSFRVESTIYASSTVLTQLAYGGIYSQAIAAAPPPRSHYEPADENSSAGDQNNSPVSPSTPRPSELDSEEISSKASRELMSDSLELPHEHNEIALYLPLKLSTDGAVPTANGIPLPASPEDIDTLVATRNMFAFLVGQSLVATPKRQSIFNIFMQISEILKYYEFSNLDGSTFGEIAASSFDSYVDELHLADVRTSVEKTIDGVILGERMRSVMLYNEAFVHAVGKYEQIKNFRSPKFELISKNTRDRMERASMDLEIRQRNFTTRLIEFDFPGVFSGIMNSKTSEERKIIRFEAWKASFMAIRKHTINYYKHKYGSWPPKANPKKNTLQTDGLNRVVLQEIYQDFSAFYDLLVDRENLTTRTFDADNEDDEVQAGTDPIHRALRKVLSEYDRSVPPFQPPIPFDCCLLPDLSLTRTDYGKDEKKDAKARKKGLKDDEISLIMKKSHNEEAEVANPFLESLRQLEKSAAHRKNIDEIRDLRVGHWLFMYAVIQSLPMLVVDAPGIKWTAGVEYFLCEPPRSGVPWAKDVKSQQRHWYSTAGGSGVVSLPSDLVEHGVEGVYRRSHCWEQAAKWSADQDIQPAPQPEDTFDDLAPPPSIPGAVPRPRSVASSRRSEVRQSVMIGLEALPLPQGVSPTGEMPRPTSVHSNDPTKTFDAIIGTQPKKTKKREKSKLAS